MIRISVPPVAANKPGRRSCSAREHLRENIAHALDVHDRAVLALSAAIARQPLDCIELSRLNDELRRVVPTIIEAWKQFYEHLEEHCCEPLPSEL